MQLRTVINPRYLFRLGLVGLMCTGMCLYCIYDGKVTYPNQQKRADEYKAFAEENQDLDERKIDEKWNETAKTTHGWLARTLKKRRSDYDINQQFVMAFVTGLIGLIFLYKLISNRGRWVEADGNILRTSEKREAQLDQIDVLDKKLWQNKGIAKVLYEKNGKKKKIVLDDCNYMRDTTQDILRHVEASIDVAKIINGKPEPPPKPKRGESISGTDAPESVDAHAESS